MSLYTRYNGMEFPVIFFGFLILVWYSFLQIWRNVELSNIAEHLDQIRRELSKR